MPIQLGPDTKPILGSLPVAEVAWVEEDFFTGLSAAPLALAAGVNNDSKPINLSGSNAFMGILSTTGAGTLSIFVLVLHPLTQAVIATRQIAAGVATGSGLVATFGAYNAALANDVYGPARFRFVAAGATVNLVGIVLMGEVR